MTKETISSPKVQQVVVEEEEPINLPGMQELATTTNRLSYQENYKVEEKMSERKATNKVQKHFTLMKRKSK